MLCSRTYNPLAPTAKNSVLNLQHRLRSTGRLAKRASHVAQSSEKNLGQKLAGELLDVALGRVIWLASVHCLFSRASCRTHGQQSLRSEAAHQLHPCNLLEAQLLTIILVPTCIYFLKQRDLRCANGTDRSLACPEMEKSLNHHNSRCVAAADIFQAVCLLSCTSINKVTQALTTARRARLAVTVQFPQQSAYTAGLLRGTSTCKTSAIDEIRSTHTARMLRCA